MTTELLAAGASTLTAVVGVFVASLAVRGYRRNDSPVMLALGVGIVAIAVVPYLVMYAVAPVLSLSDAGVLLVVLASHTLGLFAIYRSL